MRRERVLDNASHDIAVAAPAARATTPRADAKLNHRDAAERIRAIIDGGRLRGPGRLGAGRLPSERELSEELGVSRRVLRQALGLLEAEGG